MKKKLKLKKEAKILLKRIVITILLVVVDVVLYHLLSIVGEYQGVSSWCNAFLITGWTWLTIASLPFLMIVWGEW